MRSTKQKPPSPSTLDKLQVARGFVEGLGVRGEGFRVAPQRLDPGQSGRAAPGIPALLRHPHVTSTSGQLHTRSPRHIRAGYSPGC